VAIAPLFEKAAAARAQEKIMQTSYIRFGRRYSIPSTAQILDELKTGFVAGYVPIGQGRTKPGPAIGTQQTEKSDENS
jgi:hypothetical protein